MKQVEIWFKDLSQSKQKEVLEAFGIEKEEEMNLDTIALTILGVEEDGD